MENIVEKAISYATIKHAGQRRKDGTIYILHPLEVLMNACKITEDEEILAACVLHDVVEECDVDIREIEELFGKRVAKIVILETDAKYDEDGNKVSWYQKKSTSLKNLSLTNEIGLKVLILADKLSNLRSIYNEQLKGNDLFQQFGENDISKQAWYFYEILQNTKELSDTPIYKEFENLFCIIFNMKKENTDGKDNRTKR